MAPYAGNTSTAARYGCCARGRVLDLVVDPRPGLPTFGRRGPVRLDPVPLRATCPLTGVGRAFVALEDESVMSSLLTETCSPERELAASSRDPALGLPMGEAPILSAQDIEAPTLGEARRLELLPGFAARPKAEGRS
ncbi:dTDP-4-dehydrorhamnose 3,5-epimerase family protein [Amycolatopsis sp. NPDC059090]|uniref:dTDP-4-dehydrorhamnose 3,5-epimerase family protein n=1 Tax=unclassified Amycolatopsis TaxID=2618356 RepID=UPI0036733FA0